MTKFDPIIQEQNLVERLEDVKRRIGDMCSNHHGPKMSIPTNQNDDDIFIHVTINDAIRILNDYYRNEINELLKLEDKFHSSMKIKLIQKLNQGNKGWNDKDNEDYMENQLTRQLEKGNYLNAAIYCMFLWNLNK